MAAVQDQGHESHVCNGSARYLHETAAALVLGLRESAFGFRQASQHSIA